MRIYRIKSFINSVKNYLKSSPLYGRTFLLLLLLIIFGKFFIIYLSYENLFPWKNCFSFFVSDLLIIALFEIIVFINLLIKNKRIRLIGDGVMLFVLFLMVIDIFGICYFQTRVDLSGIIRFYGTQWGSFTGIGITWLIVMIILSICAFISVQRFCNKKKFATKKYLVLLSIALVIYSIIYFIASRLYINVVDNVVTLNLKSIMNSGLELGTNESSYEDYITTVKGEGKDLNIILVFAESLSAINSENLSGYNNMPKFDEIQNQGIKFTNFISNGTTSDTAHIATLLGVHPLINIGRYSSPYSGYKLLMPALPEYLNSQGYKTTFISAVSLKFLNQREFLSGAGFQKIVGEEEFKNNKKYTFESAPDWDLYDRVLQEVQNQTGKFFIGLQTISSHKPYITPYGNTEELALQYSDDMLYDFYQKLNEIGFFDNGILIIVGDHRMMNSAREGEYDLLGSNRYTRSVATIVGKGIQSGSVNHNIIQHTDFYNSIKKLVGVGEIQVDKMYNNVFDGEMNRNRGITNSEVYENNRYTISFLNGETYLFKGLSTLSSINTEIYDYFSSYMTFEFGSTETEEDIKLIGHRGTVDNPPENTLEAFLFAKEQGAVGIEFDVSYTKDYQNIVVHGPELYASNCKKEKVGNRTLQRITDNCTIKNGEKYMTLAEMLGLIDGLFDYYFLEIKVDDESLGEQQAIEAIQTVKNLNMQDKVIFISYSDSARKVLNSDNDVIFGWDTRDVSDLDFVWANNSKYFLVPYELLTPEIVQKASLMGKTVATYTVNNTGEFENIKELGVNIIMTDNISLLKNY